MLRNSRTEQLVEVMKVAHDVCKLTPLAHARALPLELGLFRDSVVSKPKETAFPASVGTRFKGRSQRFRRCKRTRSRNVQGYFGGHRRKRKPHHRRTKLCDTSSRSIRQPSMTRLLKRRWLWRSRMTNKTPRWTALSMR